MSATPHRQDGDVVALSYPYWVQVMETMMKSPSESIRQLAEMCLNLIEINKFDPETIEYLNSQGARALEQHGGN